VSVRWGTPERPAVLETAGHSGTALLVALLLLCVLGMAMGMTL
jgi:hypothetical protein